MEGATKEILERIAAIASKHFGLVTYEGAVKAGLSDWQIRHLVASGWWERIVPGVYRIAGTPDSYEQAVLAACYVAGRDSLGSHLTGLGLLGAAMPPVVPHIVVAKTKSARTRIAVIHRSNVGPLDRTKVGVIPCTTAARCLVDLAPTVAYVELCDHVDNVFYKRLAQPSDVLGSIRRAGKGRHGITALLRAMDPWMSGVRPGSPAETRLIRRLRDWGFPPPVKQHPITDASGATIATVDLAWPEHRAGLEYLGGLSHTPRDEARDELRAARIEELGWWIGDVDRGDLRPSSTRLRNLLRPRLLRRAA